MDKIQEYSLKNENGISITIISFGGIIKEINTPNRNGKIENIVLNYRSNNEYIIDKFYMGALIGRYANRIRGGKFKLGRNIIQVEQNEKNNHLHGGNRGFHKKHWKLVEYDIKQKFLILSVDSFDKEFGFPGNLNCKVKYSLNNENEFKIEFFANSDMDTIFNPTSHSYFNLNPTNNSILKHKLKINSNKYIAIDNDFLPAEINENIDETPFDFIMSKEIGKEINNNNQQLNICGGFDHCFILNKAGSYASELFDEISGRKLIISTDQPGIQFYSGNHLSGTFNKFQGLCLETQHFPDSPNNENFPSTILKANEGYYSYTKYKFTTI